MTPCQGDSVIWPTQNLRGRKYNQAEQSRAICKMCTTNNIVKDEWDSNSIHSVALQLQPCNDAVIEEPRNSEILDNNRRPEYNSISWVAARVLWSVSYLSSCSCCTVIGVVFSMHTFRVTSYSLNCLLLECCLGQGRDGGKNFETTPDSPTAGIKFVYELSPQLCAADVWVSNALHRHIIFIVFTCHAIHVNGTIHPFTHDAQTRCWKATRQTWRGHTKKTIIAFA